MTINAKVPQTSQRGFSQNSTTVTNDVPFITADRWGMTQNKLNMSADISSTLEKHGSGVYMIKVRGMVNGEPVSISSSSLFVTVHIS